MGTGKTGAAVLSAKYLDAHMTMIVAPASALESWRQEIKSWIPDAK